MVQTKVTFLFGPAVFSSVVDPDPGWACDDQKLKKYSRNFFKSFFLTKIAIYFSLGLHKGHPSYMRSLQPSKENILHFKI
jgi:hypothetical protein